MENTVLDLWAALLKETGKIVSQVGLAMQPCCNDEVLGLGYLLKKKFWHWGYATEAAAACKRYAFVQLDREKVYAIIKVDNRPSMKVVRRLGMEREREFTTRYYHGNMLHYLFSACR